MEIPIQKTVTDEEISWMLAHRPLEYDKTRLERDYGVDMTQKILSAFGKKEKLEFLACLNWPGVGTRWELFLDWLEKNVPGSPLEAFDGFAQFLGRVESYRALSLTPEQFEKIQLMDTIWPTGRLKASESEVNHIVEKYGVRHVAYARLYIGMKLVELDPSLSLHDDPETAVTISGGYLTKNKKVYLMKLSVPKIEPLGYHLSDIQDGDKTWFLFSGVYFNATWERTERYCLFEIPFFSKRLLNLTILTTMDEILLFVEPFKKKMELEKKNWELVNGKE